MKNPTSHRCEFGKKRVSSMRVFFFFLLTKKGGKVKEIVRCCTWCGKRVGKPLPKNEQRAILWVHRNAYRRCRRDTDSIMSKNLPGPLAGRGSLGEER